MRISRFYALALAGLGVASAHAQTTVLTLTGLTLEDIGGSYTTLRGGDLALNLDNDSTLPGGSNAGGTQTLPLAFAEDLINGGSYPQHQVPHINDGVYGNSNSWIGASTQPAASTFMGIDFGSTAISVSEVAWSRDNIPNDPGGAGGNSAYQDRTGGTYELEYTQVPDPGASTSDATVANDPTTGWVQIGTASYGSDGNGTIYSLSSRHLYGFTPVQATGLRLVLSNNNADIDEFEVANNARPLTLTAIGNNLGPTGTMTPPSSDIALASNGGVAFGKDQLLQPDGTAFPGHQIFTINDGVYGNSSSWIGNSANSFVGVALAHAYTINSIAFGRDNTTDDFNGGSYPDRVAGTYLIQYTTDASVSAATPDSDWFSIGSVTYTTSTTTESQEYNFDAIAGVTGVRIIAPDGTGQLTYAAIDELEVYAVPEPASIGFLALGCCALAARRRRPVR